eukprot:TRINITY_DN475_c0_g1_i1.p1 TRINITY_DN475_c0_g1~~TRINITY_DN475_c0_g1_i1.p1  ORF type:complete len:559 (-),score=137.24 TRINITY_DN475_c0_g1_i1:49-1725(-)
MSDNAKLSLEAKTRGNTAFQSGRFEEAIHEFSEAIKYDPTNHVLYSNRSGSYASLNKYNEALEDAQKTIQLKPDWSKGYSRLGIAQYYLGNYEDALETYEKGLAIDPNNQQLIEGKNQAQNALSTAQPQFSFDGLFKGDIWGRIRSHPKLAPYANQPDFVRIVTELQSNPKNLTNYINDPRITTLVTVLLGLENFQNGAGQEESPAQKSEPKYEAPPPEPKKEAPKQEVDPSKKESLELKEKGNQLYKSRKFPEAIEFYRKALEKDPENLNIELNVAAAQFESNQLDEAIETCKRVIEEGRARRADFEIIAKAYARIGNVYNKREQYVEAMEAYNKSLTESNNPNVLAALRKAEKSKREKDAKDYIDPVKALEEREKGNALFKAQNYPEAIKTYTEGLRRNPEDHVLYSNRAATYTKLGEFQLGLEDAERCIKMKPDFVKGYIRKGNLEFSLKQYHKALETYDQALKIDPENYEAKEGIQKTLEAVNSRDRNGGGVDKQAVERALADPEIQAILQDPQVTSALNLLQTDPKQANSLLRDPVLSGKLQKLINAGVLRAQ